MTQNGYEMHDKTYMHACCVHVLPNSGRIWPEAKNVAQQMTKNGSTLWTLRGMLILIYSGYTDLNRQGGVTCLADMANAFAAGQPTANKTLPEPQNAWTKNHFKH